MSSNLRIALRFLLAKKRSMLMSLAGIVFGVGFFVVTQAQTSGFQEFYIKTILGTNGAIRIEDRFQETIRNLAAGGMYVHTTFLIPSRDSRRVIEGVEEPREMRESLRGLFPNVSSISEVLSGSVTIQSAARNDTGQVFGINLEDHLAASNLGEKITLGTISDFAANPVGVLIGADLAARLQVTLGDLVTLRAVGENQAFRVSAIYRTGVRDIDKTRLFVHMGEARSLLKRPFGATFLQVGLLDRDRAPADALRMEELLNHSAMSWQEREKVWLDVFKALRVSSALTVSTIILISGLGMFNTLAMVVLEKTREISILRSMGYTRSDISRIFIWQGVIVLAAGTMLGWIVGAAVTFGVSRLPIRIRGIFSTDTFVVNWSIWHYVAATIIAGIIVMTASLIPARRAARLEPGDVIRGTAT